MKREVTPVADVGLQRAISSVFNGPIRGKKNTARNKYIARCRLTLLSNIRRNVKKVLSRNTQLQRRRRRRFMREVEINVQ